MKTMTMKTTTKIIGAGLALALTFLLTLPLAWKFIWWNYRLMEKIGGIYEQI